MGIAMALHYIFGGSGAGKSYYLCRDMLRRAKENPQENIIVLVPEQFTLQTQKDFVTLDENTKGIMNIDVLSFLRLAYRVFEETGGGNRLVLEDTGKSMIVKKVAMQCEGRLQSFSRSIKKAGFITEIKSILSEFYQYGIGEEELERMQQAAKASAPLTRKLADLKLLYQEFQNFLADRYVTTEGILELLREKVPESRLLKDCILCFDGFTGFTPSQYALIGALLKQAKECYVTVTMDAELVYREQKEQDLFYLSYKTVCALDRAAAQNGQEIADPVILSRKGRYKAVESLRYLEQNLFRQKSGRYYEERQEICVISHKNIHEEITWAVMETYRLIKTGRYRYRDIAIISADLEKYADELAREFAKAKLPCFIDWKKRITGNPVIEFIGAVMDMALQDFSYDTVFHYMKSPLSGFTKQEQDMLENYVLALGIRHYSNYKKQWTRRYRTRYKIDLEQLNHIRGRLVEKLESFCTVMKKKGTTGREKMTALFYVLADHKAEQYLEEKAEELKEKEPLRATEYAQIWRIILEMFDRIVGLMGEETMAAKEFQEILQSGFEEAKVGLVPPGIDQILAGDMERTRLNNVKVLFFLGINEGVVPKPAPSGGILSEQDRELFADQGVELAPNRRQSAFLSEFYLYLNLTKPSEGLFLSYRKTDSGGHAMRPSYLLSRVMKLFPGITVRNNKAEDCLGTDTGFRWFLKGIQEYLNEGTARPYFMELYQMYFQGELPMPIEKSAIAEAAFYCKPEQALSAGNAVKLYGSSLSGSVTRLERYAECAFAHFLTYGLGLEERAEYKISMPDIGTIYHNALQLYSTSVKQQGLSWHGISDEKSLDLLKEAVNQAAEEYGNGIFESSKRNAYLLARIEKMLKRTVDTVRYQIKSGDFEPEIFEYAFIHADRYLNLKGRIDRIDLCRQEDKTYLRVIDYKSGSTEFSLEKLYYGLQLQLAIYMDAALSWAKERQLPGVTPAGMLYYHIDDPVVEKGSNAQEEIHKKLTMHGLVNAKTEAIIHMDHAFDDKAGGLAAGASSKVVPVTTTKDGELSGRSMAVEESSFMDVLDCAKDKLYENAKKILLGDTDPSPYRRGSENACTYCSLKGACNFDLKTEGYHYHYLEKIAPEDIWGKIKEGRTAQDGDEMDARTETSHQSKEP